MNYNKRELIRSFFGTLQKDQQQNWLLRRKACDTSLYYLIKEIGGSAKKAGGDISPLIHKPIIDWWQDPKNNRAATYWPRGWRKTTCLTQWGNIREYLLNNDIQILIPSEKIETASKWLLWMEDQILGNRRLRWLYPELTVVDRSYTKTHTWSGEKCILPRQGTLPQPTFSCIGVRGASQGGHYDIASCDDVVGEKGMESPTVLEDAMRWFDNIDELLVEPDRSKPNPSIVRIVGTHWANGDFGHYVQENYQEYEWRIVPALKDDGLVDRGMIKYVQNPLSEPGESNWPEVWSTKHFMDMKANPEKEVVFYAQHQNNPQASGLLNKFDRAWLRYYHWEDTDKGKMIVCDDDGEKFLLKDIPLFGAIDPGGFAETKMVKKGSRNVILIGGQPRTSIKKFVVFVEAKKMKKPSDFLEELFKRNDEFKPRSWAIDTIGPGLFMYPTILEERSKRHKTMPIFPHTIIVTRGAKDDDIQSLIPPGENGEIYIHRSMVFLISEWTSYPNGMTQDILDALGKLNKSRWSRHPKQKEPNILDRLELERREEIDDGRSKITGY